VVLTGAPVVQEQQLVADILSNGQFDEKHLVNLTGQLTLKQLAAIISKARCFIGVDSVPMHIAAAVKTPTVALFGPSNAAIWSPWQVSHQVVRSRPSCQPCMQKGCGNSGWSECMDRISVQDVTDALSQVDVVG